MHMQNLVYFPQFILKILSGNEILTITKGHNSVVNLWNLTHNNPNLDLVKVNAYANFDHIPSILSEYIERKPTKGHNSVVNLRKLTHNNPNLDLVMVNAYAKFYQILSIRSEDIEETKFDDYQGPQPCYKFAEIDA